MATKLTFASSLQSYIIKGLEICSRYLYCRVLDRLKFTLRCCQTRTHPLLVNSSKALHGKQDVHVLKTPLLKAPGSFLESGEDADLKIECKERTWTVHALILRTQSTFFDAACKGGFKVCMSWLAIFPLLIQGVGKPEPYHQVAGRATRHG